MKDILDKQMKDALLSIQGETAIIAIANNRPGIFLKMNDGKL